MKKECTEEEARVKAEAYCSLVEHCSDDVLRKLEQWGAPADSHERIIEYLKKERFVDNRRYAIAFVRDKYRFNQWGRVKIAQALRMKRVPSDCISDAMDEIDGEEYFSTLVSLLKRKQGSVKGRNDYERNGKLIRFAMSHGYEMDEILKAMKRIGMEDGYLE